MQSFSDIKSALFMILYSKRSEKITIWLVDEGYFYGITISHKKEIIMKFLTTLIWLTAISFSHHSYAHCQIPCGIYDDGTRFALMLEHSKTIEKAMVQIRQLQATEIPDYHQITRWTITKEEHAQKIQEIASEYFLAQRVKAPKEKTESSEYHTHLSLLHEIIVAAMKAKQSTDVQKAQMLRSKVEKYKTHYFKTHGHSH
jgi:nickel superoxide dismutase